jgi:hypothetical protein
MSELSASGPIDKWSEEWWARAKPEVAAHRCIAHRKNGDRCKRASLVGQRVCGHHGGKSRKSLAAARRRLMENADPAVKQLAKIAYDEKVPIETRLKATLALIDRAGLTPRAALEVEVGPSLPYQQILEHIESGSRAAYRASVGRPDPDQAASADTARPLETDDAEAVLDAEIVDNSGESHSALRRSSRVDDDARPITSAGGDHARADDRAPGMIPLTEAVELQRRLRREAAQRALPSRWSR